MMSMNNPYISGHLTFEVSKELLSLRLMAGLISGYIKRQDLILTSIEYA